MGEIMAGSSGKVALITGVTGQDGAHLAELLLAKGYVVHGMKRRSSSFNTERIDHLIHDPHEQGISFHLHYGDVTDATNIIRIVQETKPDKITISRRNRMCKCLSKRPNTPLTPTAWNAAPARGHPYPGPGKQDPFLSGLHVRAVRQGAGDPAKGDDSILSAFALRGRKALCPLDHGKLP